MKLLNKIIISGLLTISTLFSYESGKYKCIFTDFIENGIIKKLPRSKWKGWEFNLIAYEKIITPGDTVLKYEGTKSNVDYYIWKVGDKLMRIMIKDRKLKNGAYLTRVGNVIGFCKKVK